MGTSFSYKLICWWRAHPQGLWLKLAFRALPLNGRVLVMYGLTRSSHLQVAQVILRNIEEYWKWLVILMNIDTY